MSESSMKKMGRWLGLIEDPRYDYESDGQLTEEVYTDADYEPSQITQLPERRPAAPVAAAPSSAPGASAAPSTPKQAAPVQQTADLTRIITVHPRTYNEARTIGEHFRDNVPVIMNLSEMEDAEARRLIDFASGLCYGLGGQMERVANQVYLLTPTNVEVSPEERRRLHERGYDT